jgi:spore germination protein
MKGQWMNEQLWGGFCLFRSYWKKRKNSQPAAANKQSRESDPPVLLSTELAQNLENIKQILGSPADLVIRSFAIDNTPYACAVVCIDGLIDKALIHDNIISNIQLKVAEANKALPLPADGLLTALTDEAVSLSEVKRANTLDDVMLAILSGDTAFFVEGTADALTLGSKGWASRNVEEPVTEGVVRGPREGFTENIRTNTAQIRRRIMDSNLRFDSYKVGRRSKKDLVVAYLEGVVNPKLVQEVNRRLASIDIDDAEESGYVEQWIEDSFLSPFPQIQNTERPDKVGSALLQGKVAILLDGTPFVLIAPVTLGVLFHSPEDLYERWLIGTLSRILRYIAAFISVFMPSLYIALITYHPGMIPSDLAFSMAGTREGVPFPAFVEAIMMVGTMEVLQEAGLRLPKPIGQTVGIVGGLVIGEAAVAAGIVSPVMVIIVAVTAIATISFRIIRFGAMFAAAFLGLFGVVMVYIMINIHLVNLRSFGIPYTTPYAPGLVNDWKDLVFRAPITMLSKRPEMLRTRDKVRMDTGDTK